MITTLDEALEAVSVIDPNQWENDTGPKGWFAVCNEKGLFRRRARRLAFSIGLHQWLAESHRLTQGNQDGVYQLMKTQDRLPGDPGLPPGVSQKDTEGEQTETKAELRERIAEEKADMKED